MKTLLAILLSFLITEAPVLAIHGGYTLGTAGSVTGTYAGVLIPTSDSGATTSNSLGIFTLDVPSSGVGSGTVVIFSAGRTFTGTIQAIPDASDENGIKGLINATYPFSIDEPSTSIVNGVAVTSFTEVNVTATAEGTLDADTDIESQNDLVSPTGVGLSGSANLEIDQGTVFADGTPFINETISFDLEGFQQSTSG